MYQSWRKVHTGITRTGGGFVVPAGGGGGGGGVSIGNGWTEWAHTSAGSSNDNSVTTPAIDTSSSDLLIAIIASYQVNPITGDFSDSKGNTWAISSLFTSANGAVIGIYYSNPSSVGSGHTFTYSHTGTFPSLVIYAVSGALASSPLDSSITGTGNATATSQATGSITPTQNNELVISGLMTLADEGSTPAINSSMTVFETKLHGAHNLGLSGARITQGTAGAINPTWSWTNSLEEMTIIAAFKHA